MRFELEPNNHGVDDKTLLEDLRRVAGELEKNSLSQVEYSNAGRFHSATVKSRFGSWNRALELARLETRKLMNIASEELLADIRRVAERLNESVLTVELYDEFGKYSSAAVARRFGGWIAALGLAKLTTSTRYHVRISDDVLFGNLEKVWTALGRQPRRDEMHPPLSQVSHATYKNRFGSWRKALEAFVEYINSADSSVEVKSVYECAPEVPAGTQLIPVSAAEQKRSRSVSWRMRFHVMRRDEFKCRLCGASPALVPGTILVIDHVLPWSKGGNTVVENRQTLCETCNGGKSDLSVE